MYVTIIILVILLLIFFEELFRCLLKNSKHLQDISAKDATLAFLQEQKNTLQGQNAELETQLNELRVSLRQSEEKLIVLSQERIFLEKEKEGLKAWVQDNSLKMHKDFELLANKIFNEAKVKLGEENKANFSTVMTPLKENLKEFSLSIERMTEANTTKHTSLVEQIKYLGELNQQVSADANKLAKALKSDNKSAGDWGEMILEKCLESCGFLEKEHYVKQQSLKNEDGDVFRPDILVNLPEERNIIIDSKLSLVDFLKYSSGEDKLALKAFKGSIESHIKNLAKKSYEDLVGLKSPEFVIIFIPIEGAFSLISREGQELFELAYANKIVLASPSTLLTALKTIEFLWRVDKQDRNFADIAKIGGLLYDRVALFLNRYKDLGDKLDAMQKVYLDAEKTLYEGKASISNTAQRLESLGAKTKAKIKKEDNNEE